MFSYTEFQSGINICHITFLWYVWTNPNSSSLTNVENSTSKFCPSVQVCCGEKEREENNGNCKASCVTQTQQSGASQNTATKKNMEGLKLFCGYPVDIAQWVNKIKQQGQVGNIIDELWQYILSSDWFNWFLTNKQKHIILGS